MQISQKQISYFVHLKAVKRIFEIFLKKYFIDTVSKDVDRSASID